MLKVSLFAALFAFLSSGAAVAELGPDMGGPDPSLGLSFKNGAQVASGGNGWVFKLGKGVNPLVGVGLPPEQIPDMCNYEITVGSYNLGPGTLGPPDTGALTVGVNATLPDGTTASSTGKLCYADKTTYTPGHGCQGSATMLLPAGITKLEWTIDPENQLQEWKEDNNFYSASIEVPSPCSGTPGGEVVLNKPAEPEGEPAGTGSTRAGRTKPATAGAPLLPGSRPSATVPVRERLSQGLRFTNNVRSKTSPNPFKLPPGAVAPAAGANPASLPEQGPSPQPRR